MSMRKYSTVNLETEIFGAGRPHCNGVSKTELHLKISPSTRMVYR